MSLKRIGLFIGGSFIIIILFFAYLGAFISQKIVKKEAGPFHLAFVEYTGSYKDFTTIIKSIQDTMHDNEIYDFNAFGMFFDDPKFVAEANLRSYIGVIVEEGDLEKVMQLAEKKELEYKKLDAHVYASTTFPYRNFISIFLGIMKVYPAFNEYGVANNFPTYVRKNTGYENDYILEIYKPDMIYYYMTIPEN